jgi:hypothetical protein
MMQAFVHICRTLGDSAKVSHPSLAGRTFLYKTIIFKFMDIIGKMEPSTVKELVRRGDERTDH